MADDLNLALVLKLVDKMTKPLKEATTKAVASVGGLGKTAKDTTRIFGTIPPEAVKVVEAVKEVAKATEWMTWTFGQTVTPARETAEAIQQVDKAATKTTHSVRDTVRAVASFGGGSALRGLRAVHQEMLKTKEEFSGLKGLFVTVGGAATLLAPIKAFAEIESSNNELELTLMRSNGQLDKMTPKVKDLAVTLGNDLPGSIRDYTNMINQLLMGGVTPEQVVGGLGKAVAYLNITTGHRPEQAAETGTNYVRASQSLGIEDSRQIDFADRLQRAQHAGVDSSELMYAIANSTPKAFGVQGFNSSREWINTLIYATKLFNSGERAGTALATIMSDINPKHVAKANQALGGTGLKLSLFDKTGKFKGYDNFLAQMESLHNLAPTKQQKVVAALAGPGGHDASLLATIIKDGGHEMKKLNDEMERQADIMKRAEHALATLASLWDAFAGTFTGTLGTLGSLFEPEIKALVTKLNDWTTSAQKWLETNKEGIRALCKYMVDHLVISIGTIVAAVAVAKGTTAAAGGIWNWLKNLVYGKMGKVGETLEAQRVFVTNWPGGGIGGMPGGSGGGAAEEEAGAARKGWLGRIWDGIKGLGGWIGGAIAIAWRSIAGAAGDLLAWFSKLGGVMGIVRGAISLLAGAWEAAVAGATGLTAAFLALAGAVGYFVGWLANMGINKVFAGGKDKYGMTEDSVAARIYDFIHAKELADLHAPVQFKKRSYDIASPGATQAPTRVDTSGTIKIQLDVKNGTSSAQWQPIDPFSGMRLDAGMILPGIGGR